MAGLSSLGLDFRSWKEEIEVCWAVFYGELCCLNHVKKVGS